MGSQLSLRIATPEDFPAILRVWKECGWFLTDPEDRGRTFVSGGPVTLLEEDGVLQALAATEWASMAYGDAGEIRTGLVSAVNTSVVARGRGLAGQVTTAALGALKDGGAGLAILGIFDQGYYDRFGFGTGTPDELWAFDPQALRVRRPRQRPVKLELDDYEAVHAARLKRKRFHGGLNFERPGWTRAELQNDNAYGLGFRDADGSVGHHLWIRPRGEHEVHVQYLAFRDREELIDLLGVLRSLADQVSSVQLITSVAVHPFLDKPFRAMRTTRGNEHAVSCRSIAWWQARILDLPAAVALLGDVPPFVLEVEDPVALVDGSWVIGQGTAVRGTADLPVLRCGIGTFTRLWLGVARPDELVYTDVIEASPGLLHGLAPFLPPRPPRPDWDV